jgi:uncharacterized membrane protein YphA (DoxX/SURF4 family)
MLASVFVASGARALANPDPLVPIAKPLTDRLAPTLRRIHRKIPTDTRALVQVNAAVELVAGLALATPWRRPAAAMLAGSLIPTTLAGHRFWEHEDPAQRRAQQVQFMKNLGLLGGLLLAAFDTEGRPGLRWRTGHAVHDANRSLHRGARQSRQKVRLAMRAAEVGRRLPR